MITLLLSRGGVTKNTHRGQVELEVAGKEVDETEDVTREVAVIAEGVTAEKARAEEKKGGCMQSFGTGWTEGG